MKRALIFASALMFAAPVAQAADMALKAPPPPPAPILSWTGLYIGVNAGGGWARTEWEHNHITDCSNGFTVAGCDTGGQSSNSFIGGGQIGARLQTGQFVFGIEGTADYANFHPSTIDPQFLALFGATAIDSTRLRGLYTATAQAGIAWDRELWYVKGGWAGSRVTQTLNFIGGDVGTVSHGANGWTIGTGLEYRLASLPNFSVGLEYDYVRLTAGNSSTCTAGTGFIFNCTAPPAVFTPLMFGNFHANVNELLVRANYTFNWAGTH
jgi:outer membrane immunogenic protein